MSTCTNVWSACSVIKRLTREQVTFILSEQCVRTATVSSDDTRCDPAFRGRTSKCVIIPNRKRKKTRSCSLRDGRRTRYAFCIGEPLRRGFLYTSVLSPKPSREETARKFNQKFQIRPRVNMETVKTVLRCFKFSSALQSAISTRWTIQENEVLWPNEARDRAIAEAARCRSVSDFNKKVETIFPKYCYKDVTENLTLLKQLEIRQRILQNDLFYVQEEIKKMKRTIDNIPVLRITKKRRLDIDDDDDDDDHDDDHELAKSITCHGLSLLDAHVSIKDPASTKRIRVARKFKFDDADEDADEDVLAESMMHHGVCLLDAHLTSEDPADEERIRLAREFVVDSRARQITHEIATCDLKTKIVPNNVYWEGFKVTKVTNSYYDGVCMYDGLVCKNVPKHLVRLRANEEITARAFAQTDYKVSKLLSREPWKSSFRRVTESTTMLAASDCVARVVADSILCELKTMLQDILFKTLISARRFRRAVLRPVDELFQRIKMPFLISNMKARYVGCDTDYDIMQSAEGRRIELESYLSQAPNTNFPGCNMPVHVILQIALDASAELLEDHYGSNPTTIYFVLMYDAAKLSNSQENGSNGYVYVGIKFLGLGELALDRKEVWPVSLFIGDDTNSDLAVHGGKDWRSSYNLKWPRGKCDEVEVVKVAEIADGKALQSRCAGLNANSLTHGLWCSTIQRGMRTAFATTQTYAPSFVFFAAQNRTKMFFEKIDWQNETVLNRSGVRMCEESARGMLRSPSLLLHDPFHLVATPSKTVLRETLRFFQCMFGEKMVRIWQHHIRRTFRLHVTFDVAYAKSPRVILGKAGYGVTLTSDIEPAHLFPDNLFDTVRNKKNRDKIKRVQEVLRYLYAQFGRANRVILSQDVSIDTAVFSALEWTWQTLYASIFSARYVTPTMTYRRDSLPFWIDRFTTLRVGLGAASMEPLEERHKDIRFINSTLSNQGGGARSISKDAAKSHSSQLKRWFVWILLNRKNARSMRERMLSRRNRNKAFVDHFGRKPASDHSMSYARMLQTCTTSTSTLIPARESTGIGCESTGMGLEDGPALMPSQTLMYAADIDTATLPETFGRRTAGSKRLATKVVIKHLAFGCIVAKLSKDQMLYGKFDWTRDRIIVEIENRVRLKELAPTSRLRVTIMANSILQFFPIEPAGTQTRRAHTDAATTIVIDVMVPPLYHTPHFCSNQGRGRMRTSPENFVELQTDRPFSDGAAGSPRRLKMTIQSDHIASKIIADIKSVWKIKQADVAAEPPHRWLTHEHNVRLEQDGEKSDVIPKICQDGIGWFEMYKKIRILLKTFEDGRYKNFVLARIRCFACGNIVQLRRHESCSVWEVCENGVWCPHKECLSHRTHRSFRWPDVYFDGKTTGILRDEA